ncbi:MAG TPA: FAD-dependent oxidoreductase [Anaerolineales bacterium]
MAALHARRAGWLSAQQMGMYLLEKARSLGVEFVRAPVEDVKTAEGCIQGVGLGSGEEVSAPIFINAAGPYLKQVSDMLDIYLPVYTELHLKALIRDPIGVVGRDAPLLIWDDEQFLSWGDEEQNSLSEDPETRWLTESFPAGAHTRPEGGPDSQNIILLWEYQPKRMDPVWPPELDEMYPEIALRGIAAMLPRIQEYFSHIPRPQLDGGYYTKTPENRLLAGPLETKGAFVLGALSGYGIMAACGAGELLAANVLGSILPDYAQSFSPKRYMDVAYMEELKTLDGSGQL